MASAASLSVFAPACPAALSGRARLSQETNARFSTSFTGHQLAPPLLRSSAKGTAARNGRQSTGARAFLVGPGCGPRGARFGPGFYGRSGAFPCGPQGVTVVLPGAWPNYAPPDPKEFEEYQKRQKEAYESRRAAYETRRAAWEAEAQKRRELRDKQRAFFRKQQEELCREQQKWRQEFDDRNPAAESSPEQPAAGTATQEPPTPTEPEVPPRYPQSDTPVLHLRNEANGAEVTVVGTAHISEASVEDVRRTIAAERPDAVLVELDRKRYNKLVAASPEQQFLDDMMRLFMAPVVGPVGRLVGMGLMGFYRLLAYRGLTPGKEFKAAIEEAKRVGAKVVLGDQDIDETLRNLEGRMSAREVQAFFSQPMPEDVLRDLQQAGPQGMGPGAWGPWGPLTSGTAAQAWVEQLKDRKVLRKLNAYMARYAPALYEVLVEQRNVKLVRALRHLEGKVVAVVGMSHLDGIEQLWAEHNEKVRNERQAEVSAVGADVEAEVVEPVQDEVKLAVEDADVIDGVSEETEAAGAAQSSETEATAEEKTNTNTEETQSEVAGGETAATAPDTPSDSTTASSEERTEAADKNE